MHFDRNGVQVKIPAASAIITSDLDRYKMEKHLHPYSQILFLLIKIHLNCFNFFCVCIYSYSLFYIRCFTFSSLSHYELN